MFICMATSAVHVEFMERYSTDSFLMAMQRFMCIRGTPMRIQSDRGDQLVADERLELQRSAANGPGGTVKSGICYPWVANILMDKLRES